MQLPGKGGIKALEKTIEVSTELMIIQVILEVLATDEFIELVLPNGRVL